MRIKSEQDFWSGVMFMAVGLAFVWGSAPPYAVMALMLGAMTIHNIQSLRRRMIDLRVRAAQ